MLPDFEPAVREAIYDVLFRRRGGAGLQVIKVAIGGDGDGEPSHMHTLASPKVVAMAMMSVCFSKPPPSGSGKAYCALNAHWKKHMPPTPMHE